MTYSKEYKDLFCSKVTSSFLRSLKNRGLKFNDAAFQQNFLTFITESLNNALNKAFVDMITPDSLNSKK